MRPSRMLMPLMPLTVLVDASFAASARADDVTTNAQSIVVHVDDAREAFLSRDGKIVCEAPCAVAVPRDGKYVVEEPDGASPRFALPATGEHATIRVDHEKKSNAFAGGIVLATTLPIAGLFAGLGASMALSRAVLRTVLHSSRPHPGVRAFCGHGWARARNRNHALGHELDDDVGARDCASHRRDTCGARCVVLIAIDHG